MKQKSLVLGLLVFFAAAVAHAYPPTIGREATIGTDLTFNLDAVEFSDSLDISNRLIKPKQFDPQKKYSVVLVLPTCGGSKGRSENQMKYWVNEMTAAGYLAMNVDSLTPRGFKKGNCKPRPVEDGRLLKDAYDAAIAISALPYVDKDRIFTIGFSLGAMSGMLAASPSMTKEVIKGDFRFRANAAVYGGCDYGRGSRYLESDLDRPLLVLMGAKDTEAPPEQCYSHLETLKAKKADITWHTYQEVSHGWDNPVLNGFSKTANNGQSVTYIYSKEVTDDTKRRILEFLARFQ
ncbi:MAG: dienelactone hydrolase family protein [Burkholderiaceae bacterium]